MKVPEFFAGDEQTKEQGDNRRRVHYEDLAKRAEVSWHSLGHRNVRFWVETDANKRGTIHAIRSNLVNGLPPRVET